jgi:type I restriction enzyme, S subunit
MSPLSYLQYKDSGVEWLGEVPDHWTLSKLKHFATFIGGGTPSRANLSYWGGDIPWVSPKDMKSERVDGAEEAITPDGLANSTSQLVAPGDLLLVVRSGILKHTIPCAINDVAVALNQDLKAVKLASSACLSEFLLRWIQGLNDSLLPAWSKQGATVDSIEHADLANTVVPLPPIQEQTDIVVFLRAATRKIDALIEEQQRLIELLKEKRQAVISHAVTRGLNPCAPMRDSGIEWLGEVPAHWEILRIGKLYRESSDCSDPELPILSVSIHHGVTDRELDDNELDRKVTRSDDRSKYKGVEPSDLVYNMMRAWQGGFGAVRVPGLVSPAYVVARPVRPISSAYMEQVLRTERAIEEMRRYSRGVTDFRLRLYWDEFKSIKVPVPPADEQSGILAHIENAVEESERLITAADSAIELLQERRTALISAAVTGKIDVRHAVTEVVA